MLSPKTGTGIYHEKIGLFLDGDDFVAFTGSSNESRNAFENNRECVDVYLSWASPSRAPRKKAHFEALWDHKDQGVEVYSFPEATKKQLIRICGEWEAGHRKPHQQQEATQDKHLQQEEAPNKWRHQEDALKKFLTAERGILNMATGTGKNAHIFENPERTPCAQRN